jgi:hypothetical protein
MTNLCPPVVRLMANGFVVRKSVGVEVGPDVGGIATVLDSVADGVLLGRDGGFSHGDDGRGR